MNACSRTALHQSVGIISTVRVFVLSFSRTLIDPVINGSRQYLIAGC